jgi:hypothetical protein
MERRASKRYALNIPITIQKVPRFTKEVILIGEITNISTGGMYFKTVGSLAVDDTVDFSIEFRAPAEKGDARVVGRAKVLRVVRNATNLSGRVGIALATKEYHIFDLGGT